MFQKPKVGSLTWNSIEAEWWGAPWYMAVMDRGAVCPGQCQVHVLNVKSTFLRESGPKPWLPFSFCYNSWELQLSSDRTAIEPCSLGTQKPGPTGLCSQPESLFIAHSTYPLHESQDSSALSTQALLEDLRVWTPASRAAAPGCGQVSVLTAPRISHLYREHNSNADVEGWCENWLYPGKGLRDSCYLLPG